MEMPVCVCAECCASEKGEKKERPTCRAERQGQQRGIAQRCRWVSDCEQARTFVELDLVALGCGIVVGGGKVGHQVHGRRFRRGGRLGLGRLKRNLRAEEGCEW